MADNLFGISVRATLDPQSDIQKQLDTISNGLKDIKIPIDMDKEALATIQKFNTEMDKLKSANNSTSQSTAKATAETKKYKAEVESLKQTIASMNNEQKKSTDGVTGSQSKQKKSISDLSREYDQLISRVDSYNKKNEKITTETRGRVGDSNTVSFRKDANDNLIDYKESDRDLKNKQDAIAATKKQVQAEETLANKKEALRLKLVQLDKQGKITNATLMRMSNSVNLASSIGQVNKLDAEMKGIGTKSMIKDQEALRVKLKEIEQQGIITTQQLRKMTNTVNAARSVGSLRTIETGIKGLEKNATDLRTVTKAQDQFALSRARLEASLVGGKIPKSLTTEFNAISKGYANLTPQTKNLSGVTDDLRQRMSMLTLDAGKANQGMARFAGQSAAAMMRIPIYAAGVAAMYAPIRALTDAFRQLVELDSQMTVLERVSNGAIKANQALEESVNIAEKLGNTIAEVNEGLINFGRQGFRGDALGQMAEVATVMSNVSDLSVEDGASALTAAMKGFNIEAEDSIRIVNAMNEVDNNYSITTQQLAQSVQRSAGVAEVYGSTLENLIGYTTSIGEITRESGNVIGFHYKKAV